MTMLSGMVLSVSAFAGHLEPLKGARLPEHVSRTKNTQFMAAFAKDQRSQCVTLSSHDT